MFLGRLVKNGVGGGRGWGLLAERLISSSSCYITGGGDLGMFYWWGVQTLVQKGLLDFFVANYFSQRRPPVSQSVNANRQLGTPKTIFLISLEFSLVANSKRLSLK